MEKNEYEMMYRLETSYWWFLGKHFLVRDQFETLKLESLSPCSILDIGSGTGANLDALEKFGTVYGVEQSPEAIGFLKKRGARNIICSDANETLPFRDGTFSAVTCLDVLEHLDRDAFLLQEMLRVCRPKGYLFITVPAFKAFWSPHDAALHHRRRYTKERMLRRVRGLEGAVVKTSYYNMLLSVPILAIRKLKSALSPGDQSRSDFYLSLPGFLNRALALLFKLEIVFLRYVHFPFGVSLLVIFQKNETEGGGA